MRWIGLIGALGALAACGAAESSESAELAAQACEQFEQEADDGTPSRPEVPAQLASFVTATETTITAARDAGLPACIDITYGEVEAWDSFAGGRLLGVGISGHEYNSYLVIDREGVGKPIETGRRPVFSPSGQRFASVDVSESAFGAFEALGVWEVNDKAMRRLMYFPGAPLLDAGGDWRLERWVSDDCLIFSTAANPSDPELRERKLHELRLTGQQELPTVTEAAACDG